MILCADDFGYRPDIDEAILQLVRHGRLTAVSCMVGTPNIKAEKLRELMGLSPSLDIGLHLALTSDSCPLGTSRAAGELVCKDGQFHNFSMLLKKCLLRRVKAGGAMQEVKAQYGKFVELTGRAPDFLDGHLHVHQLPGIREGVIRSLLDIRPGPRFYVRNTAVSMRQTLNTDISIKKTLAIGWFGRSFQKAAIQAGLRTNSRFAGIYHFDRFRDFPDFLRRFAAGMNQANDLLVVHPGLNEAWRRKEFETLLAADYLASKLDPLLS